MKEAMNEANKLSGEKRSWAARWWDAMSVRRGLGWTLGRSTERRKAAKELSILGATRADWSSQGAEEFSGMRTDAFAWGASCDGLAAFFEACSKSQRPLALPSAAADSVWHAWLRVDPRGLDQFCQRHFGRGFPHQPKEEMSGPMGPALARCWGETCRAEGVDPLSGKMPSLFKLDGRLEIPGGWRYEPAGSVGRVSCVQMGEGGRPRGKALEMGALTASGLMAAGAVDAAAYEDGLAKTTHKPESGSGGGSEGSSCGLGGCDGGGSDGGSSCGGGCGD